VSGVGQLARRATSFSGREFLSCKLLALDFQSRAAAAVGQLDSCACRFKDVSDTPHAPFSAALRSKNRSGVPPASAAAGVAHEVQSLSDVRRADARSADIRCPDGVTRSFHVSVNSVEPTETVLARNLLSKDDRRLAELDEMEPCGPEMPLISSPAAFACRAERLARAGASPNGFIVWPSREPKGIAPHADTGEEVTLCVACKVIRCYILY
jgi:hypothetical protein